VRGGYYSDARGTVAGAETSRGGKVVAAGNGEGDRSFVGRTGSGDIYAGRDGNVYRKNEDGWQKYTDGGWNSVGGGDRPSAGTRDAPRAENRDVPRAENRDVPRPANREPVRGTEVQRPMPTANDNMNRLQQDSQYRDRGSYATRQYNSTPRASGGSRGGRGGRR
jgi:hypothetical protein